MYFKYSFLRGSTKSINYIRTKIQTQLGPNMFLTD